MSTDSGMNLGDILATILANKQGRALRLAHAQRENNRALYIAMCKGRVPQRSIHRNRKNKGVVMGQGFAYHGHINID